MKKVIDFDAAYQPSSFVFADESRVSEILARYPSEYARSAVMPLLDLAQRQMAQIGAQTDPPHGGWIPVAAMKEIARLIGVPPIQVYEVVTFYSMYYTEPVGVHVVQVCTTTPCWLRGSDGIVQACRKRLGVDFGEHTADGKFSLVEVECLGACVNAPVVQINDTYYEDLTPESITRILDQCAEDEGKEEDEDLRDSLLK